MSELVLGIANVRYKIFVGAVFLFVALWPAPTTEFWMSCGAAPRSRTLRLG